MKNSYLNLELISYNSTDNTPKDAAKVVFISEEKQLEKRNLNSSLSKKITSVFKNEKDEIITTFEDSQSFWVIATTDDAEKNRKLGISLYKALAKENSEISILGGLDNLTDKSKNAFLEGLLMGSYKFNPYLKKKENKELKVYVSSDEFSETSLTQVTNLINGVALTRTLVNEPPNKLDSVMFSERIAEAGKKYGFDVEVLQKDKIVELGMGGLLGVNQGSEVPPTFNIMTYKPKNASNKQPLVLVGKGVTFDTGGYSLKTGGHMSTMKSDMGGAATVVGIMAAVAKNELPYYVIGLVPATDNKIDGKALLVDDVITMMDGTTVEIQNTDAEGRLILADALSYAKQYKPELVVDMATLTGAAAAITGPFGIAMAGNKQEKMDELKQAGENTYERLVQLPFWKEFEELLKSDVADLKNIGGPVGGASTAGKFLEHFTDYDWIHLDIAGPAFLKDAQGSNPSGGTGVGVRLLYDFIKTRTEGGK
ncbi:leucyl aminopeptidase [Aequorivita sp. KMM 9714]|uniref:leucyl aminopeptidase family protein n=1 Tax=Aequorivita sp. KMM 9714 TaxID=2707173 RepID=UPI0013EB3A76|nr:leucyl aminopeptidase [Aequorivita sp. KMM 9714]NGX83194.1 leucyl aminopeptidase [Aequorivita sp. KMM 9714]